AIGAGSSEGTTRGGGAARTMPAPRTPRTPLPTPEDLRMDLRLRPEHEAFRDGIRAFLAEHGRHSAPTVPGQRRGPALRAWQRLLLEHGYAGRTVPREYGGYGAAPDVMEQYLIVEEFTRAGVALGIGNQGISMLVPTLLELGTEEQKRE